MIFRFITLYCACTHVEQVAQWTEHGSFPKHITKYHTYRKIEVLWEEYIHDTQKIEIKAHGMEDVGNLYTYFLDSSIEMRPNEKRPVILMCPGGGYEMTSDREAEPMAMQFLAMGYHVAILRYSVSPVRYPVALQQVAESVLYLKEHADEYHIDPGKNCITGMFRRRTSGS